MKRLFGTDGIRGVAGRSPLEPETVRRFGAALAEVIEGAIGRPARLVLGRDTRESGLWLRDEVAAGLAARHAQAVDAGVIPTPGLAWLARTGPFDAGVMISASHNPFEDNGLKVFGHDGTKLLDALEAEIEARILDGAAPVPPKAVGQVHEDSTLVRGYVGYLEGCLSSRNRLAGMRVVLDCAHGAASAIASEIFRFHGAEVETLGASPDGRNINHRCGSLHLDGLAAAVIQRGFDLGIAFDGDADRALAVDRRGRSVTGDHILYLAARRLNRDGALRGGIVVATVMSNLWLEMRLRDEEIRMIRAPVGDKYVYERMVAEDAVLGGEQSGHIIFRDLASTGDGILTGLQLADCLVSERLSLEEILDGIVPIPQVLINVTVRDRPDLGTHPVIGPALARAEAAMAGRGRVLLRYSGTEPLARVMIEGEDQAQVNRIAAEISQCIRREIGA